MIMIDNGSKLRNIFVGFTVEDLESGKYEEGLEKVGSPEREKALEVLGHLYEGNLSEAVYKGNKLNEETKSIIEELLS